MLYNHLLTALRTLFKHKIFVIVNGLAIGLSIACCIVAYLWVAYDREFDEFHDDEKVSNVFKLHSHWDDPTGQNILSPYALGPKATEEIAGISKFTRYTFEKGLIQTQQNGFNEGIAFSDKSFFKIFDFQLVQGSFINFEDSKYAIITETLSAKLFGKESPLGKDISLKLANSQTVPLIVGAVIKEMPQNTSFTFDMMVRVEHYQKIKGFKEDYWGPWPSFSTFFELQNPQNQNEINEQFQRFLTFVDDDVSHYQLEHFKAQFSMDEILGAMVNIRMWKTPIAMLTALAFSIFLIACFNLTNTSLALISGRLKEFGIRKVMGSSKVQIFSQLFTETILIVGFSLFIGILVSKFIISPFSDMWGAGIGNRWDTLEFRVDQISLVKLTISMVIVFLFGIIIAGVYPSFVASKQTPLALISNQFRRFELKMINKALILIQFSLSLVVLTAAMVFTLNANYFKNQKRGFDDEQLIYINVPVEIEFKKFRVSVNQIPGITRTCLTQSHLGVAYNNLYVGTYEQNIKSRIYEVGEDYFETAGIKIKYGEGFLNSHQRNSAIITKQFSEKAGLTNAIDEIITISGKQYRITGITEDIVDNWFMLDRQNKTPIIFISGNRSPSILIARTNKIHIENTLENIQNLWKNDYPNIPFQGGIHALSGPSKSAENLKYVLTFLTIMCLLISLLGLFTMTKLSVESRTKEIGIRKVLGSSVMNIINLISHPFIFQMLLSILIGTLASFLLLRRILESEFRLIFIDIGIGHYLIPAVVLLLLGSLCSLLGSLKIATKNPVDSLKSE